MTTKAVFETDYLLGKDRRNHNEELDHQQYYDEEARSDKMYHDRYNNETVSNSSYERTTGRHFSNLSLISMCFLACTGLFVIGGWDSIRTTTSGEASAVSSAWKYGGGWNSEDNWHYKWHHNSEKQDKDSDDWPDWEKGGSWHDVWPTYDDQFNSSNKKYHEWKKETSRGHSFERDSTSDGKTTRHATSYETWSETDDNGTKTYYRKWTDNNGDIHYQEWSSNTTTSTGSPPIAKEVLWGAASTSSSSSSDIASGEKQLNDHTNTAPSIPNTDGEAAAVSNAWKYGGGWNSEDNWHYKWHHNNEKEDKDSDDWPDWEKGGSWHDVWPTYDDQFNSSNKKYHEWKKETSRGHSFERDSTSDGKTTRHATSYETWSETDDNGTKTYYRKWTDNNGDIHYQEWSSDTTRSHHHY